MDDSRPFQSSGDSGFWVAVTDTEPPLTDNTEFRQEEQPAGSPPLTQGVSGVPRESSLSLM